MKRARFLPQAREEFLAEVAYYNTARSGTGTQFVAAVEAAVARALAFPLSGAPLGPARRMMVRHFPFSIIYRDEAEGILVIAVAHRSRRPGYWRDRTVT
ncbi:type II toxin-antitoxin system RelE/ParE family toxin [Duganella sp. LX20W]|uniref:Type II toxin-antitoxin system RelE/ParE family toxin n=1 Tax=Rugamonas brunnea TaxID=2758569 RepID=A0A7W2EW51_9BURK|nr:type II toxin-antitoxin system RelE/ParE family toxin [Rugamonas brunnea]MBA5639708.1 type II toxin-antitoxin system RelE/ParE family toxin [Rugamonas brunnea]